MSFVKRACINGYHQLHHQIQQFVRQWRTQVRVPIRTLGNREYGSWTVAEDRVNYHSVVYSFGVGEDVSWDLAMIELYGVEIHAFDPTPRSVAWVESQILPDKFHFHPFGIADFDGMARFFPPENTEFVSHTMVNQYDTQARAFDVPVKRLGTIMRELGHDRIDVLKMDIEGAEYAVIDDISLGHVSIGQVLVEFHHNWEIIDFEKTRLAIRTLNKHGYRIFHISPSYTDYAFIRLPK